MTYSYYPGCTLKTKAKDLDRYARASAAALGIELQDYTGYLSNLGGKVPLASLLELINGAVSVTVDGQENKYESGETALKALTGKYEVASISDLKVELKKPNTIVYAGYETWAQQHKEETGEDVSFF